MTGGEIAVRLTGRLGPRFVLDVDFRAPMRGITALFGPSGCGKTSILRAVAGLHVFSGSVRVGEDVWQDGRTFRPVHRRPIGYVFQEASLFAHLNVFRNLTYGLRRAPKDRSVIGLGEVVDLLRLGPLIERMPTHLSGGERQRVAIGRALLAQPRLLLMDEPLAALDRMARDEILPYLEALHAGLNIPILLVTHDMAEVERLADHIVLLHEGRVVTAGPLDTVLSEPGSVLAGRRDFAAILPGRVRMVEGDGIATIDIDGAALLTLGQGLAAGSAVRVRIAAGDVSLSRSPSTQSSILNALPVEILAVDESGPHERSILLRTHGGAARFRARISARSADALGLAVGDRVHAQIKSVSLVANR